MEAVADRSPNSRKRFETSGLDPRMHTFCIITSENISEYAGVQKFILDLASFIVAKGSRAVLVSRKDSASSKVSVQIFESSRQLGFRDLAENELGKSNAFANPVRTLLLFAFATLAIVDVCRKQEISIIHAQDIFFSGLAGAIAHKLFSIPLVVHAHGPSPYFVETTSEATRLSKILMRTLARLVIHNSNLVLATDNHTKLLLSPVLGKTRCMRIPTPVRTEIFLGGEDNGIRDGRASDKGLTLGFIGRLCPQKNLGTLLSAFASASVGLGKKAKLVVVGDGPERNILTREAVRLGMHDRIIFAGPISDQRKVELLSGLDIFVLPSIYEGCPITLLEAMASGRAIIASDIPAIREIVRHREEAILVNPCDVNELKRAILSLCDNPNLRSELGRRARKRAKLYGTDAIFKRLAKIYEKVSAAGRPVQ